MLHVNAKARRAFGLKKEQECADRLGAEVTLGSGADYAHKGDFALNDFLVEHKATLKESFSIKGKTWDKILKEASAKGKIPAMIININGRSLVVMEEAMIKEI